MRPDAPSGWAARAMRVNPPPRRRCACPNENVREPSGLCHEQDLYPPCASTSRRGRRLGSHGCSNTTAVHPTVFAHRGPRIQGARRPLAAVAAQPTHSPRRIVEAFCHPTLDYLVELAQRNNTTSPIPSAARAITALVPAHTARSPATDRVAVEPPAAPNPRARVRTNRAATVLRRRCLAPTARSVGKVAKSVMPASFDALA